MLVNKTEQEQKLAEEMIVQKSWKPRHVVLMIVNEEKDQQKRDAVNVRVKNAEVKSVNPSAFAATGADKVPVEAGMVNDLEGMSKEAKDLTKQLK